MECEALFFIVRRLLWLVSIGKPMKSVSECERFIVLFMSGGGAQWRDAAPLEVCRSG